MENGKVGVRLTPDPMRSRLWLLIAIVFLAPAVPACAGATPAAAPAAGSPAALRQKARSLWDKRKTSAEPWLLLGRAYEAEGKKGKAFSQYKKAISVDPRSAEAYYRRGRYFEEKGKLDEAANEYQAALKADASYADAMAAWKSLSARLAPAE